MPAHTMENGTLSEPQMNSNNMPNHNNLTEEKIIMTPKSKTEKSTTIIIERREVSVPDVSNNKVHVAGGAHSGIIIEKELTNNLIGVPCTVSLEFKVFLVNAKTQTHTLESRVLRFWFKDYFDQSHHAQARSAQEFFKLLVSPTDFPRDYVGFITKTMKLLQAGHNPEVRMIEMELSQLEESETAPQRPMSADDGTLGEKVQITETKVLEMIESAYPNPVTLNDISKQTNSEEDEIKEHLTELQSKGLIKEMENNAFTRVVQNERSVKIVKQMPTIGKRKQPTIAIITAQYCEKLAVDAMIEDQETFVRYTTVGESNVYTLGTIGHHRVVSTKLPSVGHTREAMIAAGNTTTRLLGTFQKVEYVFLIGVGGGVPHFTDYNKHVRLGDVVVAAKNKTGKHMYMYCESTFEREGELAFDARGWSPMVDTLQDIAANVMVEGEDEWSHHFEAGYKKLKEQEADFTRPPASSDKLYMAIGEREVIEVAHPTPVDPSETKKMESRVHIGTIASGRQIARDDHTRQEMASQYGILAYDSEFDSVVQSIIGNCKEAFIVIRGISDYKDGTRRRDWQPHAALLAAAFAKALIIRMEPPQEE